MEALPQPLAQSHSEMEGVVTLLVDRCFGPCSGEASGGAVVS